ncbi:transketolase [candidate division KSB1 bacterium]|nr:transketolase [candidate division KSB1 bacterium]
MKITDMSLEEKTINAIRTLSMDGVQKANSGHPGTPMALAPLAYVLWSEFLKYNPKNPKWFDRDRFVLSNGHASMLQYAVLHLFGYNLTIEDLKNFRQWESKTPGHPENGLTPGVETTTGPLGQGLATAVGMAIAEAHLAAVYNKPDFKIIDHHTYVFCGDGDLMEGVSNETSSLAGHLGLAKLICFYDDNHITIEGETELAYSDNAAKRFESYGWHVLNIGEKANDLQAISAAVKEAKQNSDRPSMIIIRTHIGYGAPNLQDTSTAHGAPLGEDEIKLTKKFYGWPEDAKFWVPEDVTENIRTYVEMGKKREAEWNGLFSRYEKAHPQLAEQLKNSLSGELPTGWDRDIPVFSPDDGAAATRGVGGSVLNAIAKNVPWLVGGSADLSPSTKTLIKNSGYFAKGAYQNKNIAWGVREFGMCAAASGLVLHGGLRSFASTFFVFTDYARPAIRLAALMKLPVIYVMTHDSIGVGEDGPTHQPVEHLASLRIIPNMCVIRPADANETAWAWRAAMQRRNGPTVIALTRQKIPVLDQSTFTNADGLLKGAYILSPEKGGDPHLILIATGSEVTLALEAQKVLTDKSIRTRVVSMPSWELFREQTAAYREKVLPSSVKARVAIEAGSPFGWREWVGDNGAIIAVSTFGASAPAKTVFEKYGFTINNIVTTAQELL